MFFARHVERMKFQGTVADVLKKQNPAREVVVVDSKSNFFVCLWQLQKHNISSAPIFDAEKQEYVGLIDLLDMVTFALVVFEDRKMLYEREFLQHASGDLVNKPELNAHLISNMSARNRFVSVHPTDSIETLMALFNVESGLHRVCVLDENKKLVGLVSQFDLIRHFATLDYKEMAHLSVGDWAVKPLVKCKPSTEASHAFEMLIDKHVSAVPVLDDAGHLITSFSASDLKGAEPGLLFKSLQDSVVTFLKNAELRLRQGQAGRRVLACKVGESLFEVMNKLILHSVHRLWVVNDRNIAIGVISFADIFTHLQQTKKN